MLPFITLLGTTVFVTYASYLVYTLWDNQRRFAKASRDHGCKPVPTVSSWDPILGIDTFSTVIKSHLAGRRSELYKNLHIKYGPTFSMKLLGVSEIQTAHPENIQAICTSSFNDFGVNPMRGNIGAPFLDRGIFTEDGEFWKHSRALVRPTFSKAEIANLGGFERHVARYLALLPKDGSTIDLLPLTKKLFLDTSTEFLFGQSTECLGPESVPETDEFMKSFDRSLLGLALLLILGPFRWPLYIDPYWKKAYTKVHSFIDKRVQQALVKQNNSEEVTRPDRNNYVLLEEMAKITQDPYRLRMQILNVFFPARDTAAIGFSDVMFELARHPDEWARLRKEVDGIHPGQDLSFEFLRSLDITKSIIQESLRLHPAASRIGRTALRDTVLPKGGGPSGESSIFVPHGTVIEMDLYTVQRNEQFWGGDANEFKPSRWLRKGRPLWEAKWQYEPFLGGVRMCPAQNQVLIQLAYLLVRFTQEVRTLENRDEVHEYVEKITMTVESKHGVKVALSPVVKT